MTVSGVMWGVLHLAAALLALFAFALAMGLLAELVLNWLPALLLYTLRWSWWRVFGGPSPVLRLDRVLEGGSNGS